MNKLNRNHPEFSRIETFYNENSHLSNHKLANQYIKQYPDTVLSFETLRRAYFNKFRKTQNVKGSMSKDEKNDTATYEYKGDRPILSEKEAIIFFGVDTKKWYVDRMIHNSWDSGEKTNYQTKLFLKRILEEVDVEEKVKDLFERLESHITPPHINPIIHKQDYCAIINIYDAHIDKLSFLQRTNTLEDNITTFYKAFDTLLNDVLVYNPETIYFPIGNDFFNTNGPDNNTKKGTPQQVNSTHWDSFDAGLEVLIKCIEKLASVSSKVIVPFVGGNHSFEKELYAMYALQAWFRNTPHVEFDITPKQRKYFRYNDNMFAFAHGDKEKGKVRNLPLYMAQEAPFTWANTKFRTFFLGDIHHKEEYQFHRVSDQIGVEVKFLRSISKTDEWHFQYGWIGVPKSAQAEVFSANNGRKAIFETNF